MSKWLDLETQAPEGWFSQYDISALYPEVAAIPEGGLYLEVGVHKGRSLWVARQAAKSSVEIWGIDLGDDPKIAGANYIQGDSHEADWDKPIDVLFIDANHSYKGCKGDIEKYAPFVKSGGVILFHDYDVSSPGVIKAVDEYAASIKTPVQTFLETNGNTSIARIKL